MKREKRQFAICIQNEGCEDLELRKVYPVLVDKAAEAEGYLRVVDESEEDYLYPAGYFAFVELPAKVKRVLSGRSGKAATRTA